MSPAPGLAPATADPVGPQPSPWRGFARRGLRNQVLCAGVALAIWLLAPANRGNLFTAWIYSAAIGTCCWFFIDGGRLLVAHLLPATPGNLERRRNGWPGPGWMLACILVGTGLGYSLGATLGDRVTGFKTASLFDNRPAIGMSLVLAVAASWYFYATERLRAEQAATEAARRQATESQLMLLQSQLEPHMLFNTLANLRVLITLDPPRAQAMLDRLIGYLRATLGASRAQMHPLSAEFERLDDYLALMALRMGPRLQVQLHLPAALRPLPVPPLLLQPLVENSIRHGLEPKVDGGRIEVRAEQRGQRLLLTVRDSGIGLPAADPLAGAGGPNRPDNANSHYGTQHVAARLATLYGTQAHFTLAPAPGPEGGVLAEVDLPWPAAEPRPMPAPAA